MKLDIFKLNCSMIRMNMYTEENRLDVLLYKDKINEIYSNITGLVFNDVFDIDFSSCEIEVVEHENKSVIKVQIDLNSITWNKLDIISIKCQAYEMSNMPTMIKDIIDKSGMITDNYNFMDHIITINGCQYRCNWVQPETFKDVDVIPNPKELVTIVDANRYKVSNYDEVVFYGECDFRVINIPKDYEILNNDRQGLMICVKNKSNDTRRLLIYLNGHTNGGKNMVRVRKIKGGK